MLLKTAYKYSSYFVGKTDLASTDWLRNSLLIKASSASYHKNTSNPHICMTTWHESLNHISKHCFETPVLWLLETTLKHWHWASHHWQRTNDKQSKVIHKMHITSRSRGETVNRVYRTSQGHSTEHDYQSKMILMLHLILRFQGM